MTIPFKDNRVFLYWNKHGKAIARHGGPRTKYHKGLLPPNYPVPAIQLTVDYWHDTVGIFAWNNPADDNGEIVYACVKR